MRRIPICVIRSRRCPSGPTHPRRWLASAVVSLLLAGSASSLTFDPLGLVYEEDFDGESVYPTTPDLDVLSIGGGTGSTFLPGGTEIPGGPALDGSVAIADVVSGGDQTKSFVVTHPGFGDGTIGIRAGFDNLIGPVSDPNITITQVVVEFDTAPPLDIIVNASLALQVDPVAGLIGVFWLEEYDRATEMSIDRTDVSLTPADATAIATGSPFVVDLEIDRGAHAASASLVLNGVEVTTIGPRAVTSLAAGVGAFETNVAMTAILGGVSQVEIDPVMIYTDAPAGPLTFTVDTLADAGDASIGDGVCATASRTCSLRAAIAEANATPIQDTIILPGGTYVLSGLPSALSVTEDLVIQGDGASTTIVDGNGAHRVFEIGPGASDVIAAFSDLTIRNGLADGSTTRRGGGILNHGDLTLEDCRVTGNEARQGGGMMNFGRLSLDRCVVDANHVSELAGGTGVPRGAGLAHGTVGAGMPAQTLDVTRSAIVSNTSSPSVGASGIELAQSSDVRIENSTVSGNAGVAVDASQATLVLTHATIVASSGAALRADIDTKAEISNSALEGAPACDLATIQTRYLGNNASNDVSCAFVGAGDVSGVPLGLVPLVSVGSSRAHLLTFGSPLVDGADATECLLIDQVSVLRPMDGDGNGIADCDIGAIEVPEPGLLLGLAIGSAQLSRFSRARRRRTR